MLSFLKSFFTKSKYEYVYFYIIDSELSGIKENIRIDILHEIQNDCSKHKKSIVEYDFITEKEELLTTMVLSTSSLKTPIIQPLIWEIYCFPKKKSNVNIFTYKYKEILFQYKNNNQEDRILTIFKFKIKC